MAAFAGIVYFNDEFANTPAENNLTKAVRPAKMAKSWCIGWVERSSSSAPKIQYAEASDDRRCVTAVSTRH